MVAFFCQFKRKLDDVWFTLVPWYASQNAVSYSTSSPSLSGLLLSGSTPPTLPLSPFDGSGRTLVLRQCRYAETLDLRLACSVLFLLCPCPMPSHRFLADGASIELVSRRPLRDCRPTTTMCLEIEAFENLYLDEENVPQD